MKLEDIGWHISSLRKLVHITPARDDLLRVVNHCDGNVRVCILGSEPYHYADISNGLAYAIKFGSVPPPILITLMHEMYNSCGFSYHDMQLVRKHGTDLSGWMDQGVLLLNRSLTSEIGIAGAHRKVWDEYVCTRIRKLIDQGVVFGTTGKYMNEWFENTFPDAMHVKAPTLFEKEFLGSKFFLKINSLLSREINWKDHMSKEFTSLVRRAISV